MVPQIMDWGVLWGGICAFQVDQGRSRISRQVHLTIRSCMHLSVVIGCETRQSDSVYGIEGLQFNSARARHSFHRKRQVEFPGKAEVVYLSSQHEYAETQI